MEMICNLEPKMLQQIFSTILAAPQFQNRRASQSNHSLECCQDFKDVFDSSTQPAQCRSKCYLRFQLGCGLFQTLTAFRRIDHFFNFVQSTGKPAGEKIGKKADTGVRLWTVPPGDQAILREFSGIGAMLCKSAAAFWMKRTAFQLRLFPGTLFNVLRYC